MNYPNEKLTATSKYSHTEICVTLDQWYRVEAQLNTAINALDYSTLDTDLVRAIDDLEPIVTDDGFWHRAGNTERFPVAKWKKLIKQHERTVSRLRRIP